MSNANDHSRITEALHCIPPDLPREKWLQVGMALHSSGCAFEVFDTWSSPADNYKKTECRTTWQSFKLGKKGITIGTLFKIAKEDGWVDGDSNLPRTAHVTSTKRTARLKAGMDVYEIWNRCEPATNSHPYIQKKIAAGVPLEMLRVVPAGDSLTILNERMAGALVVPVIRPNGTISTLQFITTPEVAERLKAKGRPDKLNLPGPSVEGWHTVGSIEPGGVIYIVEGIGQAWACWQATGHASVSCFGFGNIGKVAKELRKLYPSTKLVLVPDAGKEDEAIKIADDVQVKAEIVLMPEGWQSNSDVNDLKIRDGAEALQILLESASKPPQPTPLLKPVSVFDVITNPAPPTAFIWDGLLPRGVVTFMSAHGGTGKSTIALMLGVAAAFGLPLFGLSTTPCKTLFVSLEDNANIVRLRLANICRLWDIDPLALADRFFIVDGTETPELFTAETRGSYVVTSTYSELLRLVQPSDFGIVIVDNSSDAFDAEEIQRRQVRAFIRTLAKLVCFNNGAVLLLAHVDKATSRSRIPEGDEGYSGSTGWHNSARSRLFLKRLDSGQLKLEQQKSNLGKKQEPITVHWPDDDLPQLMEVGSGFDVEGRYQYKQGRIDDEKSIVILKLIAEYESRQQFCSPAPTSRNHVHLILKTDPIFISLKLRPDDTKRIVTQCQRANWLDVVTYRSSDRKSRDRWSVTTAGRTFAGMIVQSAPSASTTQDGASKNMAQGGAPTAPTGIGGMGE